MTSFANESEARAWAAGMFTQHRADSPAQLSDDALLEWLSDMARVGSANFPTILLPEEKEWVLREYRSRMSKDAALQYRGIRELRN